MSVTDRQQTDGRQHIVNVDVKTVGFAVYGIMGLRGLLG